MRFYGSFGVFSLNCYSNCNHSFDSARGKPPDPHYSITRNTNTITYSRAQFRLYTAVSYLAPLLLYCVLFAKANNIEVAPVTGLGSSAQGWMVTVSLPLGVRVQSTGLDGRKLSGVFCAYWVYGKLWKGLCCNDTAYKRGRQNVAARHRMGERAAVWHNKNNRRAASPAQARRQQSDCPLHRRHCREPPRTLSRRWKVVRRKVD